MSWRQLRWWRIAYGPFAIAIGVLLLVLAVAQPRDPSAGAIGIVGFLAVTAGVTYLKAWPVGRWLAGVLGSLFVLYGASVLLLGGEDVGGLEVAIPVFVISLAIGGLNFAAVAADRRAA